MRDHEARYREAGGQVAIVTQGTIEQTAAFRARNRLPFPCLSDPQRQAYAAYRVPRGTILQIAGPAVWWAGFKATLRHGFGIPRQDAGQMPATFVIDRGGRLRFVHHPRHQADVPREADVLAALRSCVG